MKRAWIFLFTVLTLALAGWSTGATMTTPAWNRLTEAPQFFRAKGFHFEVTDLQKHDPERKSMEVVVDIPQSFIYDGLTNTFYSVMLLNNELAVDLQTWPYEGRQRAIIMMSKSMIRRTDLYFYYKNASKGVTDGTQYVVRLAQVVESLKDGKAQPSRGNE